MPVSSQSITLAVPPILPNIIRWRTPPISERATDGSACSDKGDMLHLPSKRISQGDPIGLNDAPGISQKANSGVMNTSKRNIERDTSLVPLTTQNLVHHQQGITCGLPDLERSPRFPSSRTPMPHKERSLISPNHSEGGKSSSINQAREEQATSKNQHHDKRPLMEHSYERLDKGKSPSYPRANHSKGPKVQPPFIFGETSTLHTVLSNQIENDLALGKSKQARA